MAIDLRRFEALKKQEQESVAEGNKAEGMAAELLRRIKEEFGLPSLKAAKKELDDLSRKKEELETQYNRELADLEKKYNGKLKS